jgi:c-di-GMP-binding flagellar brake protein YcgR
MSEARASLEDLLQDSAEQPAEGGYRREHRRFSVDRKAEIQVISSAALFRGRIVDLSLSGCYIQTIAAACLPPDSAVEISFVLNAKAMRVQALSKRSKSKVGMGFRFVQLSDDERGTLKQYITSIAAAERSANGA